MRVAMVINGYYPRIGGAERQLAAVAPLLQAGGVDVHVITRRFPGLAPFETIAGVSVHRLAIPGTRSTRSLAFTFAAVRRMARLRPNLVHAHDVYSPATAALLTKKLLRAPVVVKVPRGGRRGSIAHLRGRALGRQRLAWLRRGADAFITINREIDDELAAMGVPSERRVAIPNGVHTARFKPLAAREKARLRRSLDLPRSPVVIFTGRLAPEKRLHDLLAIWPMVRERHAGALLVLVGSGSHRAELESQAGEGVRFAGSIMDVAPYLQTADLFVLPSAAEGLSNSLLEAMSTGLPCITTTVGGAPDLIDHGRNGWLVPPGEPDRLRHAILTLLADPDLRESIAQRARQHVEAGYSLPRVAAQMRGLYRELVERNRSVSSARGLA